jgi:hypothetical protein
MPGLLRRSTIVALAMSIVTFVAWGLWNGRVIVFDPPVDHTALSSMRFDEALAYQRTRSHEITGWGYIWHTLTEPSALPSTLQQYAWHFLPQLLACLSSGLWHERARTRTRHTG